MFEERQTADDKALNTLMDLYSRQAESRPWRTEWKSACRMLEILTREEAQRSTSAAEDRVYYLEVPEPAPVLENFFPRDKRSLRELSAEVLAKRQRTFEAARDAHTQREQLRLKELEAARSLYDQLRTAERAKNLKRQRQMWPPGVILDPDVAEIEGIESQVDAHNASVERQVDALTTLLAQEFDTASVKPNARPREPIDASTRDPQAVAEQIETALSTMRLPIIFESKVRAAYTPDSRQAVVEYELPDVTVVPRAKSFRYIKSRAKVTETARPASQVKSLYAGAIAQLALLCLGNVFASDENGVIDVAVFNGVVDALDPRSGQPIRPCLITVRVTRDTFAGLNLARVDPQACLKHLSAGVSKSPTELAPVRPVLEFSMVDPRFIAETDAIKALDDRPNLLELTFTEFESLIQNLFTKMGLEARQTRPSRDGGVDCVAYDTRPIFGGKIVIQAKRYKNTVGVSAVRDLYGTLQNEGASKGILVTTSGYGAASFDFAQNKPIELIDGANLLYLLEEHTGVTARIQAPDDWRDPRPDSGEAPSEPSGPDLMS